MEADTLVAGNVVLRDLTDGIVQPVSVIPAFNPEPISFTFAPLEDFVTGHEYQVTVTTGVEDVAGNSLASDYSFSFTSIGALVEAPRVVYTSPANGASNVRTDASIVIRFSQNMETTTITDANIFLDLVGGASVPIVLTSSSDDTFVFAPDGVPLSPNSTYQVTVTSNVRDEDFVTMARDFTFTFTTGSN
jgi:hypothetical protein